MNKYMFLDRLRSDCEYFLGNGNGHEPHLWAGNVEDQIAKMFELYDELSEKPEWLSRKDISSYGTRMLEKRQERVDAGELKYTIDFNCEHREDGHILFRVKALRDINNRLVKKGDLGGWIEMGCLSQQGECWVGEEAAVFENARVEGDAYIGGNATVRNNAIVRGSACVIENAVVQDRAIIEGKAFIAGYATVYRAYVGDNARIAGCAAIIGPLTKVVDNATVGGTAGIDTSCLYDNVIVRGNSKIRDSQLHGDVIVDGKSLVGETVYNQKDLSVHIKQGWER